MRELTRPAERLQIASFEPLSASAWPGKLAAILFLQGCPWKCGYCHNADIIDPQTPGVVAWADVVAHLRKHANLLDGVIFSGGEPTRQLALVDAMARLKELGFAIGLHTNGAYPTRLEPLLPMVDWVGLDIKATSDKYQAVTGVARDDSGPMRSLQMLLGAGVSVQVRTTLDPLVLNEDDVLEINERVTSLGVTDFVVQRVRAQGTTPQYTHALAAYRAAAVAPDEAQVIQSQY